MTFTTNVYDSTPKRQGTAAVSTEGPLPVTVRTADQQWAYALRFGRTGVEPPNADSLLSVRVRVDVASGSIGVGCLNAEATAFLDERIVNAGGGPVEVELLAGTTAETGPLIIRNASADGGSEATVLEIVCSEAAVRDDSDQPRHPPLHEPPIVPDCEVPVHDFPGASARASYGRRSRVQMHAERFAPRHQPSVHVVSGTWTEHDDDLRRLLHTAMFS